MDTVVQTWVRKLGGRRDFGHIRRLWSRRTSAPPSSVRLLTFPILQSLGIEAEMGLAEIWRFHSRLRPRPIHAIICEMSSLGISWLYYGLGMIAAVLVMHEQSQVCYVIQCIGLRANKFWCCSGASV